MPEWLRNTWILLLVASISVVSIFGANIWQTVVKWNEAGNELINPFEQNYGLLYHSCVFAGLTFLLILHLRYSEGHKAVGMYLSSFAIIIGVLLSITVFSYRKITASFVVTYCYGYGVILFIGLCELLLADWGRRLTVARGENWTKEIDYLYLTLAVVGVIGSMDKISGLTGQFTLFDPIAPFVLTTAIVLRFIKTRAEVGSWNKREFYGLA